MAWIHLDSATQDGTVFDLYERDGIHMIRVDGWELMNGAFHQSEDILGELAARLARRSDPDILVGGLGLGFTLASLVRHLGGAGRVTVAELSAAVIRWFDRHTGRRLFDALPDHVRIRQGDVLALAGEGLWDAILLDVDNGPQPLSAAGNSALYSAAGLAAFAARLKPDGALLLWSAFEDPGFVDRARAAGFAVTRRPVARAPDDGPFHVIYVLSRSAIPDHDLDGFGLERL
jgi:spermidine synthase